MKWAIYNGAYENKNVHCVLWTNKQHILHAYNRYFTNSLSCQFRSFLHWCIYASTRPRAHIALNKQQKHHQHNFSVLSQRAFCSFLHTVSKRRMIPNLMGLCTCFVLNYATRCFQMHRFFFVIHWNFGCDWIFIFLFIIILRQLTTIYVYVWFIFSMWAKFDYKDCFTLFSGKQARELAVVLTHSNRSTHFYCARAYGMIFVTESQQTTIYYIYMWQWSLPCNQFKRTFKNELIFKRKLTGIGLRLAIQFYLFLSLSHSPSWWLIFWISSFILCLFFIIYHHITHR